MELTRHGNAGHRPVNSHALPVCAVPLQLGNIVGCRCTLHCHWAVWDHTVISHEFSPQELQASQMAGVLVCLQCGAGPAGEPHGLGQHL